MKYQGRQGAEWGYKNPTEGSYNVVIGDEIDIITNKDSGKSSLKIPTIVTEGEFAKANITIFCPMDTEFGEQKVADVIANVGLMEKFNQSFPGDISFFDAAVIKRLQQALPGKPLTLKLEPFTGKDGKVYGNIVQISKAGTVPAEPGKQAGASKSSSTEDQW